MNNKGFAVKELIILFSVLAVLFALAITKVSFAFEEVDQEEQLADLKNSNLLAAANVYVMMHKDLFTEAETYFYGSDLVENQYLLDLPEESYNTVRFKVTKVNETDEYKVEIA